SQEVESEVSSLIEDAVATVSGIEELRSISADGRSFVIATFNLDRNIDAAAQDVRDAVSGIINRLPPGIDPPVVQKRDLDSSLLLSLSFSCPRTSREFFVLSDLVVEKVIDSSPGVGQVSIAGVARRGGKVDIAARRLAAQLMSFLQV